jgi:hypothetical protein
MRAKDLISTVVGNGVILLMIAFLCLVGLACLATIVRSVLVGPFDGGEFALSLIAGVLFGGAGLFILYMVYMREAVDGWVRQWRQDRYGDRPWMLKREWRRGQIPYRAASPLALLWIFSLGWNSGLAVVLTGNRLMILDAIRENWLNALGLAVFVLIGLGVLAAAVRMTFTRRIEGWALFTMDPVPGVIGGKLRGSIQTRIPAGFDQAVALTLAGPSGAPFEQTVARERMHAAPRGLVVPVEFDIPASCQGSNPWDPAHKVEWTLKARARVGGKEWEASFVVPLFKLEGPGA